MSFRFLRRATAPASSIVLLLALLCTVCGLGYRSIFVSQAQATPAPVLSPDLSLDRIYLNGFEVAGITCDPIDPDSDGDGLLDLPCLAAFTPPDPSTIATAIDPTVVTNFLDANRFIYAATSPIQRGMQTGAIQDYRATVLRGKVVDADQNPLPGVLVRVLNHPEIGYTYTRSDGVYDLVANGGGDVVVDYRKNGYLRAQRRAVTPWQDWSLLPTTTLLALDANVTTIGLNATTGLQIHRATVQTDAAGARQATVMIPAGTQANMVSAGGAIQPLTSMHFRATEYTVGAHGPERMPASLPATSGYTYAVELSADEAIAADARQVTFTHPLALYFENYRGFPVGTHIPVGYYDFSLGSWLPSNDGRVIQVLGNSGGFADLDLDGSGHAADAATLARFGISDAERASLAILYPSAGQTLWRSTMAHLTPWDCNFPYGPPPGSQPPAPPPDEPDPDGGSGPDPDAPDPHDPGPPPPGGDDHPSAPGSGSDPDPDPDTDCGSIIDCNNGQLGEIVPVTGTPYALSYRSNRLPGANLQSTLRVRVPVTGARIPTGVRRVIAYVTFAGIEHQITLDPPVTNYIVDVPWDGLDNFGRPWQGPLRASVIVGYVYPGLFFSSWEEQARSFATITGYGISADVDRGVMEFTVYNQWTSAASVRGRPLLAGYWDARGLGLGGWSLSDHHVFDPVSRTIYMGDGRFRRVGSVAANDIAGVEPYDGAGLSSGYTDALGADGSIYHLQQGGEGGQREVVYRLRPGQTAPDVLAQNCPPRPGHASACLTGSTPLWLNATKLLADESGAMHLLTRTGIYRLSAPRFSPQLTFDPSSLDQPCRIQRGSWQFEQRVYFACVASGDTTTRIYMLWPNGDVSLVAGGGVRNDSGAPAAEIEIGALGQIAVAPSGALYFTEFSTSRIRRIGTDGIVTTVTGTGTAGFAADGSLAATSMIDTPTALAVSRDGVVLFADSGRIREINRAGQLHTLLGGGSETLDPRAGNIGRRVAIDTSYLAVLPDGSLVFDGGSGLLRWNRSSFRFDAEGANFKFPSEDGREVYVFDPRGHHLQTLNALTGAVTRSFTYNSAGYLTAITDGDGNATLISRDGANTAHAIISPFGQTTLLDQNGDGMLNRISAPAGRTWNLAYKPGFTGLLQTFTPPNGQASTIGWDVSGRLLRDTNAEGGYKALSFTPWAAQSASAGGVVSAMGRTSSHYTHLYPGGARYKTTQRPDGTEIDRVMTSAYVESEDKSGMLTTTRRYDLEPRFGLNAPIVTASTVVLPNPSLSETGLRRQTAFARNTTPTVPNADLGQLDLDETVTVNGTATTRHYDSNQRRWTITTPEGRARSITLNVQGRPLTVTVPGLANIEYAYDARGRLSTLASGTGADRRTWRYGYDASGYLASIQDPLLRTVSLTNDGAGRPTQQTLPDSRIIGLGYDASNNVTSITPPGRGSHQFTYNRVDRVTGYQPPSVGALSTNTGYTDNADSQIDHSDDADARRTGIAYLPGYRLPQTLTLPEGSRSFTYVGGGRVNGITATDGVSNIVTWNGPLPSGQSWSGEVSGSVRYAYDNALGLSHFWLASVEAQGSAFDTTGSHVDYRYDHDGLMTHATAVLSGSSIDLGLTRDPANGLLNATALGAVSDSWGYNAFAEPVNYSANFGSGALYSTSHVRDGLGRLTQTTETIGGVVQVIGYGYDLAGRLHTVTRDGVLNATYAYDSNSNRLSKTTLDGTASGTYDAQDRMSAYGGSTFTYNNSGQLTGKTVTASGAHMTYQYDTLGNLRHVALPSGTNIDYVIDGMNRRVGKKLNGAMVQEFLYLNQLKPIAELDGTGATVSSFVYAERSNIPSLMIRGGHTYRIVADHLGSPRLIVDIADGSIAQRMDYDEFGNMTNDTNPGFQPFGFAGGLYDRDTGLVRFGARDYDPATGRWTAKDLILFRGKQTNLFEYAKGNPVAYVDPVGLDVRLESTTAVNGFHQRIAVDTPNGPYGQSFGMSNRNAEQQGSFDASHAKPAPGSEGSGIIYDDTNEQVTKVDDVIHTTPEQDEKVVKLLQKNLGNTGPYNAITNSCRTYSRGSFIEVQNMIESGDL